MPVHTGPGRARSNAIFIPGGGPGRGGILEAQARQAEAEARGLIDTARKENLRQMFAGTTFITKKEAAAKRAKEVADAAKKVTSQVNVALGQLDVPTLNIPMPSVNLPNFSLPSIDFPNLPNLPDLPGLPSLPDIDFPTIDIPELRLPSIDLPDIGSLNLNIPGIRSVLQLLMELFDGLALPDILAEIGIEIFADFLASALPILGQIKSGAQAANLWGKAAKKAYQVYKVEGQKQLMLPGDPRAAADAVKVLLKRAGLQHTANAGIKTTQFVTSSASLALDAGALSGPLISAAASLATLTLRIHAIGVAHKEKIAGNEALKLPENLDSNIFVACPTLGCYLLTCSDTSSVVNILTTEIGRSNWMTDVSTMKRKLDPLLLEATTFIRTSPYELQGLKMNKGIYAPKKKSYFFR